MAAAEAARNAATAAARGIIASDQVCPMRMLHNCCSLRLVLLRPIPLVALSRASYCVLIQPRYIGLNLHCEVIPVRLRLSAVSV